MSGAQPSPAGPRVEVRVRVEWGAGCCHVGPIVWGQWSPEWVLRQEGPNERSRHRTQGPLKALRPPCPRQSGCAHQPVSTQAPAQPTAAPHTWPPWSLVARLAEPRAISTLPALRDRVQAENPHLSASPTGGARAPPAAHGYSSWHGLGSGGFPWGPGPLTLDISCQCQGIGSQPGSGRPGHCWGVVGGSRYECCFCAHPSPQLGAQGMALS